MKALVKKVPANPPEWYQGLGIIERQEPVVSAERTVKIKTVIGGICGTDVGIYLGKDALANAMASVPQADVILGHEFCGRVVELHDTARQPIAELLVSRKATTEPVGAYLQGKSAEELASDPNLTEFLSKNFYATAEMHFTCGTCLQCRGDQEHVCKNTIGKGMHEDGAFTDFMVIPANRLVLLEGGEVPPEIISFMDALGNAVHTAQSAKIEGSTVLITGAGVQGLMSCAVAKMMGADKIFVTDVASKDPSAVDKFSMAKKLGADFTFDVGTPEGIEKLYQTIQAHTDNTGVDVVFEMSGHYGAYPTLLQNIRMGGTLLLLGLPAGKFELDFSKEIIFKGLTVKGIYGRRIFETWELMRQLLVNGLSQKLIQSGIITHQLPLEKFDEGFQALITGRAIKVLLKP